MKITIITATYNSFPVISDCIKSISSQQNVNIEHIIIDGGSTDATLSEVKKSTINTTIISEPDNGIYDALNKGIGRATGDIIGFLHSDDMFSNATTLSDICEKFKNQKIDVLYGDLDYINSSDSSKVIRSWRSKKFSPINLYFGWMPPHPTLFVKKEVYQEVGKFDVSYSISADYDFCIRLFKIKRLSVYYFQKNITKMRVGGASNKNLNNILLKMKEDRKICKTHHIGGWYTVLFKNIRKLPQLFH